MTHEIDRGALRAFFEPYAEQAHKATERVHLHCCNVGRTGDARQEWHHHRAGYVCQLADDAVAKFTGCMVDWMPFNTINRITIHTRDGALLREYQVTDGATQ